MIAPDPGSSRDHEVVRVSRRHDEAIVRLLPMSEPISDAAVNRLHSGLLEALEDRPRRLSLDLTACTRPDSRVLALACEAMRECVRHRVRLVVHGAPALRTWLAVYRLPMLGPALKIRHARRRARLRSGAGPGGRPPEPPT